jgi:glycosyltransferase involved in cell wall biosynthesis
LEYSLHLIGLAHTKTNKSYNWCAYTQKVLNMAKMMTSLGVPVYHYGAEGSEVECENVVCVTDAEQRYTYEDRDWTATQATYSLDDYAYQKFNERAIKEIKERIKPHDIILVSNGLMQKPITDAVGGMACEMGIGYTGVFADYKVFESYAWMHYIYGLRYHKNGGADGQNYDAVIPNYFDLDDFEYSEDKDDYYLYVGRFIPRKGLHIAAQVCDKIGARLVVAGQGDLSLLNLKHPVENVGYADVKKRSQLMSKAKAVFVPSLYLEPFGGVAVEAMLCGTPVITSDWGGFTETVQREVTGFRCRNFRQFIDAAQSVHQIKPQDCRQWAERYSMDNIKFHYLAYFNRLQTLYGEGWYELG